MKKFILGFLLGALLFSIVPVSAAIEEYILYKSEAKLIVDGQEYNNPDLPILNYKGYNYIPAATFRNICKAIGVDFQWVGEVKQIQLKTNKVQTSFSNKSEVDKMSMTSDGLKVYMIDGVNYVLIKDIVEKYNNFNFSWARADSENKILDFIYDAKKPNGEGDRILIENIPYLIYENRGYVTTEYYESTILPIIKTEGN